MTSAEAKRRLVLVPIVHSPVDAGSLGGVVRDAYIRRGGEKEWQQHVAGVEAFWRTTREEIERLGLDWQTVRLFQDGLPECGREVEIVRDLAEGGSPNHQLLQELMERGATLTGTESPALLLEEYALAQRMLASSIGGEGNGMPRVDQDLARELLIQRDQYIAQRIDQTLCHGETGMIFLGLLHDIAGHLPPDVLVSCLTPTLGQDKR